MKALQRLTQRENVRFDLKSISRHELFLTFAIELMIVKIQTQ